MLRYRVSGEIIIETEDTLNDTKGRQFIMQFPIGFSGDKYSFNLQQFINKRNQLQEIIKQFIEREL